MKKYLAFALLVIVVAVIIYVIFRQKKEPQVKGNFTSVETYVDVRTDEEWQAGHLNGAIHFDLARLTQGEQPNLPKDTPLALYCRSGNRAGQALTILKQRGFTTVRNAGGFETLKSQGSRVCLGIQASCN